MISVKFQQRWASYNSGEVAGFPAEDARHLVDRGFAVVIKPEPAPVAKAEIAAEIVMPATETKPKPAPVAKSSKNR